MLVFVPPLIYTPHLCYLNRLCGLCGPLTQSGKLTAFQHWQENGIFGIAGQQVNGILTYTTMRNPQRYNSTQASTGVKQHSQDLCLKQRLRKGFSKSESLIKWQRSSQETHHTCWEETSLKQEAQSSTQSVPCSPQLCHTPHTAVNWEKGKYWQNMSKPTNTERKSSRRE